MNHNENECCTLYINSIIFHSNGITFNIDIMHNAFRARISSISLDFIINMFTMKDRHLMSNISNLLTMGKVEEGKNLELKFMDSEIRANNEKFVSLLETRFEKIKDNYIIILFKNKQLA